MLIKASTWPSKFVVGGSGIKGEAVETHEEIDRVVGLQNKEFQQGIDNPSGEGKAVSSF